MTHSVGERHEFSPSLSWNHASKAEEPLFFRGFERCNEALIARQGCARERDDFPAQSAKRIHPRSDVLCEAVGILIRVPTVPILVNEPRLSGCFDGCGRRRILRRCSRRLRKSKWTSKGKAGCYCAPDGSATWWKLHRGLLKSALGGGTVDETLNVARGFAERPYACPLDTKSLRKLSGGYRPRRVNLLIRPHGSSGVPSSVDRVMIGQTPPS